jgi:hypothetical protein
MQLSAAKGRSLALVVGLALCSAAGCGPSYGSLSGKVTYNGKELKGGYVTLVPEGEGESFAGEIQEDGTYQLPRVKTGKYKICVDTSNLRPVRNTGPSYGGAAKKANNVKNEPPKNANLPEFYKMSNPQSAQQAQNAKKYVEIPEAYANPQSTTLSIEVKTPGQTYDIPLS